MCDVGDEEVCLSAWSVSGCFGMKCMLRGGREGGLLQGKVVFGVLGVGDSKILLLGIEERSEAYLEKKKVILKNEHYNLLRP